MIRTILVTTVADGKGNESKIYGRYDAVALYNKGYKVIAQHKAVYEMSDEDFATIGKMKKII